MTENLLELIRELGHRCHVQRIVLFGSRARGDHRPRSDINLAVFGLPEDQEYLFMDGIHELPTLLKFDVVFVSDFTDPELLNELQRDGVCLYKAESSKT